MARKFKFKLDSLLKMREFKEKRIKVELGEILKEMTIVQDRITVLKEEIEEVYKEQELCLQNITDTRIIQAYPRVIEIKHADIDNNENLLFSLKKKYDEKVYELAMAKGEVKVLDNLREKKAQEHKKEIDKKIQEEIEEHTMIKKYRERKGDLL